jgi:hypothetical protein
MLFKTRELKQVIDLIFEKILDDSQSSAVKILDDKDFYWDVSYADLFAVTEPQPKLDIGRLSDDWDFLKPLLLDKQQAVRLMLMHVAPLLRYLGEKAG